MVMTLWGMSRVVLESGRIGQALRGVVGWDTRLCVMCVRAQMYISVLNHDPLRVQVKGLNTNKHQYTDS
jgi:hypothetical protein